MKSLKKGYVVERRLKNYGLEPATSKVDAQDIDILEYSTNDMSFTTLQAQTSASSSTLTSSGRATNISAI